jgi:hypothetical protein
MPSAKQDERALVIIHSASNSLRNRSFLPKARSVLVARSGSCPSGTPPGAEAGNEIPSPQVLSIWIIEESNTWSSKASGGTCGNGPHSPVAQSWLAERIANKRRRLRQRRLLMGPSPLRRSDLSRPSDPIVSGGCRDKNRRPHL